MSQVIKVSPSTADTSESNNSIDENNRNDTDSERGATTVLKLKRHSTIESYHVNNTGIDVKANEQMSVDNLSNLQGISYSETDSEKESDQGQHNTGMQRAASQPVHGLTNDQILQLLEENERLKEEAQYRGDEGYEIGNHHLHPPSQNGDYQQNDFFYGQHVPYNSNFHQNDSSYYGNPFVPMNGQGMWQMGPPQACVPPYMPPSNPFYGRPSYPYMAQGGPNFSYQQSRTASGCGHRHDSWYHPTQYHMLERDHHQRVGGLSSQPNQIAQHQRSSTTDDHRFCEVHRSHHTHTGDDLCNSPASTTGPPCLKQ